MQEVNTKYVRTIVVVLALVLVAAVGRLGAAAEPILRILLSGGTKTVELVLPQGGRIVTPEGKTVVATLGANGTWRWAGGAATGGSGGDTRSDQEVGKGGKPAKRGMIDRLKSAVGRKRRDGGRDSGRGARRLPPVVIAESNNGVFKVNGKSYRGRLEITFSGTTARLIDVVGLESYVRGVVAYEIGGNAPPEALRAQAVIARTFAMASRGKHGAQGADLCAHEHCQVYGGVSAERAVVDTAVADTRGVIMVSQGKEISTLYHATCGGFTSDNGKVWGGAQLPYLRRVKCPFCKEGQNFRWRREISWSKLKSKLASEQRLAASRLTSVAIEAPATPGGQVADRVDYVVLQTDRGAARVRGTTFRSWFSLPSSCFSLAGTATTPPPAAAAGVTPSSQPPRPRAAVATSRGDAADAATGSRVRQSERGIGQGGNATGGGGASSVAGMDRPTAAKRVVDPEKARARAAAAVESAWLAAGGKKLGLERSAESGGDLAAPGSDVDQTSANNQTGPTASIADAGSDAVLIVQTSQGLRSVTRPAGGWRRVTVQGVGPLDPTDQQVSTQQGGNTEATAAAPTPASVSTPAGTPDPAGDEIPLPSPPPVPEIETTLVDPSSNDPEFAARAAAAPAISTDDEPERPVLGSIPVDSMRDDPGDPPDPATMNGAESAAVSASVRAAVLPEPKRPAVDAGTTAAIPLMTRAAGSDAVVLIGRGYGHLVGLCQSGAIAMAKLGWRYRQILPYYYSGVVLRKMLY